VLSVKWEVKFYVLLCEYCLSAVDLKEFGGHCPVNPYDCCGALLLLAVT
jgi:hypothetical protein